MSDHARFTLTAATRNLIIAVAGVLAVIVLLALLLPLDVSWMLFVESGPVETASALLWLAVAAVVLIALRPTTPAALAGAVLCVAAAAREADWHKRWTDDSTLKVSFYLAAESPAFERVIAGLVSLLLVASIVIVLLRMVQLVRHCGWRSMPLWMAGLIAAMVMLVVTKVVDRLPALLEDEAGYEMDERTRVAFRAFEEGGELLIPIIVATAVLSFCGHRIGRGQGRLDPPEWPA